MANFLNLILLLLLFGLLGLAANFVVKKIKYIASALKVKVFVFGVLLGIVTTLPELSVGLNTTLDDVSGLSAGNILGGIIVILGLVLGSSLVLNRKTITDGNLKTLLPQVIIIFLPILFGLDGRFGLLDGLLMVGLYFALIYHLYLANHSFMSEGLVVIEKNKVSKAILLSVVGIISVLLISHWVVRVAGNLLQGWDISKLMFGLIIFSLGTNLPEISIALMSWRKKASELSLSYLLSSSLANVLVLGILAVLRPIAITIGPAYYVLAISIFIILALFLFFYRSDKEMSRFEGLILLSVYLLFLFANFWLIGLA